MSTLTTLLTELTSPTGLAAATSAASAATAVGFWQRAAAYRRRLHTDPLTGLPNRIALAHAVARTSRYASTVGLLMVDLDGFKTVNDHHGHDAGNQLLQQVADRLVHRAHPGELVTRLHGDEFAIYLGALPACAGLTLAEIRADQFTAELARPTNPGEHDGSGVPASIGVAVLPTGASLSALLTVADRHMYQVKQRHHARHAAPVIPAPRTGAEQVEGSATA